MRLPRKKFNSNFQCPFTQIFRPRCYTKFCLCFTAILSCLPICCWNVDMSGLRTAIYRKILYNSGFLSGKNGLLRCNFEQLLVVIRAFVGWLMHFYDLHWGVLRFFAVAKAEIAGFMATGLPCELPCDDVLARFYVVFASQSYVSGRFCLGFMILGVVGLRCVGVLACLGFFGACCGLFGWSLAGLEIRGNGLFLLGLGVEIAKFAGLFVVDCFFAMWWGALV